MSEILEPRFEHDKEEKKIYDLWEKSGYFNPDNLQHAKKGKPFSIIMPPPNANGHLHAGHAMFVTIEDIMMRFARMRGKKALWLPGADHAGFETQVVYEKKLEKEGRSRFGMQRDELYKEIMDFTLENKKHMESELRSLGASCDWSREKFTLEPGVVEEVNRTFEKLYKDKLVYRGSRIVNWCPKHQTSFSDLEITDVERNDPLYYLQYGPFTIATARPETKFGDKYVVMHPDDKRYSKYRNGDKIELEWINGPITATVVKDKSIDMKFGTGVMTITPWHSGIDFEIAQRHNLDKEQIIDEQGRLLPVAGEFSGMKIAEARPKIIEKMKAKGLLVKIDEAYKHTVKTCYKCGTVVEPQIKEQWFVKTKPLAAKAISAIKSGKITFLPKHYKKICLHWLENIIDWNISRQIAWGIRIPAWYCLGCSEPRINPEVKSRWFLVRHGETEANKRGITQGQREKEGDVLTEEGIAQVQKTAEFLKTQNIGLIVSSDLERCRMTAEIISKSTRAKIIYDPGLRERHLGEAEGMPKEERNKKYGTDVLFGYRNAPPGGETFEELEMRVWDAFQKNLGANGNKNVVVVSHGGVIRTVVKKIKRWSHEEFMTNYGFPKNASIVSLDILDKSCQKCGNDFYEQDKDVFDTWFSSGQWPFVTLGYPKEKDFKTYYPTSVMETAGEIIFFWVTRMIMLGLYVTKKVPFKTVYLHGLVLDAKGQKMSKSKGNVINPLEITSKYGTDALRMTLVSGNTPGTSLALSEDKIRGYRNFTTKVWNISRFILMNKEKAAAKPKFSAADKKNIADVKKVKAKVAKHIEKYEFHLAAEAVYHYVWHAFADKIIEDYKPRLNGENAADAAAAYSTLETILVECLKILHPFMPFVTEAVYQKLGSGEQLMVAEW